MKEFKALLLLSTVCVAGFVMLIATSIINQTPIKTQPNSSARQITFIIKGSIPYWDQESAFFTFKENVAIFSYINLFWYNIEKNGTIEKYEDAYEDKRIINFAHSNNVKVLAVVTNLPDEEGTSWDSSRVENIIKNKSVRDKHIENIIKKIEEFNFDGVTIDYEEVRASQKDNFSSFIKELSSALHKRGKIVIVALHPKNSDFDNENGEFQDWKALAQNVDQLNIMAYGEHWDESNAGPIASIKWVEKIIEYAESLGIPSERFILGIPLYGYDWNKNDKKKAAGLTYKDVQNLLAKFDAEEYWDSESASPYFLYNDHEDVHEVWFENARSVNAKIELAKKAEFSGVTFWRLGGEDQKVWEEIAVE